ncbi:Adenylate cyclase [Chlorella sorokiniana]|uniref:Adenylate cyclase n=1 Tax=Chlorella sorokiniana TaxID=3076 RepID=A0A2P6TC54_CHLSO|nr:Adenylate cyclase [Chlorella sorokiniana]|eukprot:PRW20206.1 Adenylate cyclase [Chlorella sorokiniana]
MASTSRERVKAPLYVDRHPEASVLVAEFRNQAALLALSESQQFKFLHDRVYLALDAVAGRHKVYKVQVGPLGFVLSTNVAEADAQHAATLLRCARELLHVVGQVRLPCGQPLGLTMALSSGAITSGLLGTVSLTYQLVGRCVTVAHQLCKADLPLVATRSFRDTLPAAAAAELLPLGRMDLPCCPGEPVELITPM